MLSWRYSDIHVHLDRGLGSVVSPKRLVLDPTRLRTLLTAVQSSDGSKIAAAFVKIQTYLEKRVLYLLSTGYASTIISKLSAMCNYWSNHCLHHLLPSERDTGHDLRHRGHSYQLVCYNFSSTRRCFVIRMLHDSL